MGTNGTLFIENKSYGITSSVVDKIFLEVCNGNTVNDYVSEIVKNNYYRYDFAEGGSGTGFRKP